MESNKNLLNPYVQDGRDASSLLADFIGLSGDGERSNAALDTFLNSTGYQNTVNRGVSAITSNRAAAALDSGATLKAVSDYGQRTAMSYADRWLNLLSDRVGTAFNAARRRRCGQSFVTGTSANNQSAADAASNGAINNANIWEVRSVRASSGRYAGQSSFPTAKSQTYQAGTLKAQPVSQNETFRPFPSDFRVIHTAVDWSRAQMPNILGMYDEGWRPGRNQAGQTIIDNALANYSADPRAASAQIMRVNPQLATTRCNRRTGPPAVAGR